MNAEHFAAHTSHRYNEEMEHLRSQVLSTGGLIEQQLTDALAAMIDGDTERAERVVLADRKINGKEREIDEQCTSILARRQPLASDLRLLIAVMKVVANLERMGDEAKRVARMVIERGGRDAPNTRRTELRHLGTHVRQMLHDALDAFARGDTGQALRVMQEDQNVDREYETLTRELITVMMEDPRSIPRVLESLWSARALERIGDRACNISEYVIYFVNGHDVRHVGLEHAERAAREAAWIKE